MARLNDFLCDVCGRSIATLDVPFVIYVVTGIPGRSRELFLAPGTLPAHVEAMNELPESRVEYCVECWARRFVVHPDEVTRLLELALAEHQELHNPRKVDEIRYKLPRIRELAAMSYRAGIMAAAQELGLVSAHPVQE